MLLLRISFSVLITKSFSFTFQIINVLTFSSHEMEPKVSTLIYKMVVLYAIYMLEMYFNLCPPTEI
jgi:hypothetical protein